MQAIQGEVLPEVREGESIALESVEVKQVKPWPNTSQFLAISREPSMSLPVLALDACVSHRASVQASAKLFECEMPRSGLDFQ